MNNLRETLAALAAQKHRIYWHAGYTGSAGCMGKTGFTDGMLEKQTKYSPKHTLTTTDSLAMQDTCILATLGYLSSQDTLAIQDTQAIHETLATQYTSTTKDTLTTHDETLAAQDTLAT
jgi:hypothetical protein